MNFYEKVYALVREIPRGKVATYGQIAKALGSPNASRAVGYALHHNPDPSTIPCHMVVSRDGRLSDSFAFGGKLAQRQKLEADGVKFLADGNVDMKKCQMTNFLEV